MDYYIEGSLGDLFEGGDENAKKRALDYRATLLNYTRAMHDHRSKTERRDFVQSYFLAKASSAGVMYTEEDKRAILKEAIDMYELIPIVEAAPSHPITRGDDDYARAFDPTPRDSIGCGRADCTIHGKAVREAQTREPSSPCRSPLNPQGCGSPNCLMHGKDVRETLAKAQEKRMCRCTSCPNYSDLLGASGLDLPCTCEGCPIHGKGNVRHLQPKPR